MHAQLNPQTAAGMSEESSANAELWLQSCFLSQIMKTDSLENKYVI